MTYETTLCLHINQPTSVLHLAVNGCHCGILFFPVLSISLNMGTGTREHCCFSSE